MGDLENPEGAAVVGDPSCGDQMKVSIRVDNNRIIDIKFKTFGCMPHQEEVVLRDGSWKKVSDWPADLVNKFGNQVDIKERYLRRYNGKLLKIIPFISPYNSFMLTPNHPVLAIKREWMEKK